MIGFAFPSIPIMEEGFADPQVDSDYKGRERILAALRAGQDCTVGSMDCANPLWRGRLEKAVHENAGGTRIAYVFFENDIERCNENCRRDRETQRDVGRNVWQNERWKEKWITPDGAFILGVYPLPEPK